LFRQKSALDASGQGKIALQGALLGARKMVKTESNQWIGEQALGFDGVVTCLAKTNVP